MSDNKLFYEVLDSMRPDEEQKSAMWSRIEQTADAAKSGSEERVSVTTRKPAEKIASGGEKGTSKKNHSVVRRLIAIAAALVLVLGGISWFTSKPADIPSLNGYVYAAESRATDMTADEVLVLTGNPAANSQFYVYAPKIYYLDGNRIVFGNGTGLIVYNIPESKVEGLIDMQAICSGYYNCDTIGTHVLVNGDELIVYNTEYVGDTTSAQASEDYGNTDLTWKPWGYFHIFDLSAPADGTGLLQYKDSGNDEATIEGYIEQGKAFEAEHYVDAWDHVSYLQSKEMDDIVGYGYGSYSELAYVCKSETGELMNNILVCRSIEDGKYELCSAEDKESAKPVFTELDLGITDEVIQNAENINQLPEYKYTGSDAALGVICDYLAGDYTDEYFYESGVSIPAPTIYAQEEKDGELLVFGDFWMDQYCKNGNTLISVSGGAMPACFHLVSNGGTYEIAGIDVAEDGESFGESIKKMTKDFPGLESKFLSGSGQDESIRRDAIREYVVSNGLGIDYYKDYGWDPMELN